MTSSAQTPRETWSSLAGLGARRLHDVVSDVRRARRSGGPTEAVSTAAYHAKRLLRRPVEYAREFRFDRRYGIDTRGRRWTGADVLARAQHPDGTNFGSTPVPVMERMFRAVPGLSPAEFTFVDLGCGKGTALAVAAMHGFGRVIGVELDGHLAEIAERNATTLRTRTAGEIEVREGDASLFRFPPEPTLLFLSNPFGEATMSSVVEAVVSSVREHPRPFFVAYWRPLQRRVWDQLPGVTPVADEKQWVLYGVATAR